jgi:hypothetical protein
MWVLLQRRLALYLVVEPFEHFDVGLAEGITGGLIDVARACLDQLQGHGRRLGGDRGQLDQLIGRGQLTVLQLRFLQLDQARHLLDRPA